MSAAAVQQLADVLPAVSSGVLGYCLVSTFDETDRQTAVLTKLYQPSSLKHKAICHLDLINEHTVNSAQYKLIYCIRPVDIILSHNYRSSLSVVTPPRHLAIGTVGHFNIVNLQQVAAESCLIK